MDQTMIDQIQKNFRGEDVAVLIIYGFSDGYSSMFGTIVILHILQMAYWYWVA